MYVSLSISFFVKSNVNWNKNSFRGRLKKSSGIFDGHGEQSNACGPSFSVLSVLHHAVCNFPSCHCGALIKEAIGTVNILTSNQPTSPPSHALLTNINQFIYSQEVTSCI